jgi:hypothetical protein
MAGICAFPPSTSVITSRGIVPFAAPVNADGLSWGPAHGPQTAKDGRLDMDQELTALTVHRPQQCVLRQG